jgi:hypothetical protein
MWQWQYLRALEVASELTEEADHDRLARSAARRPRPDRVAPLRRVIAAGARSVGRAASTIECWADPTAA